MAVTQKDIAEKLNVSIMTVSKALKGHPDISTGTRKLIIQTASKMNYTVNILARNLAQKKTNTIGVVLPDISESFYAEMIRGIESSLRVRHYNILLSDSDNCSDIETRSLQSMLEQRVDGLLFCPTEKSDKFVNILKNANVPTVFINYKSEYLNFDSIYVDRSAGAYLAVSHLLEQGYEKIFFFYTHPQMAQSKSSIQGCSEALMQYKISIDNLELVSCPEHEIDTFYEKALNVLMPGKQRVGVFAWDDEMAIGIYRALIKIGGNIPEDFGIIGFDDIKISKFLPKSLTTIRFPKYEMGKKGAEHLLRQLEATDKPKAENTILKLELIKRETT